jgi:hypothetical protein
MTMTMTTPNRNNGPHGVASVTGAHKKAQPTPVWLAALVAARCSADDGREQRSVSWECISGRAVYTNGGPGVEWIELLGVYLQTGETLAVYWMPGETAYTMEVYGRREMAGAA